VRKLPAWATLAVSLATVGPTLAMSGNGQGLIGTVAGRDTRFVAQVLLWIEGVGILAMIVLVAVIFARSGTGFDLSVYSLSGVEGPSAVLAGVVAAFLSWAGFEACSTLGEEADDPRRTIRLVFAFARDGFGSRGLSHVDERTDVPRRSRPPRSASSSRAGNPVWCSASCCRSSGWS
jgi:hypothetical protein